MSPSSLDWCPCEMERFSQPEGTDDSLGSPTVAPAIYDPAGGGFTSLTSLSVGRTAVVLPDGRVLSAGSDRSETLNP